MRTKAGLTESRHRRNGRGQGLPAAPTEVEVLCFSEEFVNYPIKGRQPLSYVEGVKGFAQCSVLSGCLGGLLSVEGSL